MRIAMYHHNLPQPGRKPGGVEVFVHRLAQAMSHRGHEVEVLTYSPAPSDAQYRIRRLRPYAAEEGRLLWQYGAPWLLNFQSFAGFDVAHFHGDDWFYLRRRLPTVRTFYGSALLEARNAVTLKRRVDKGAVFLLELVANALATSSYAIGADSEVIYQTSGRLPLGIDLPSARQQPSPRPSILFVGTWHGRKRGSLLFDVFQREIRPAVPDAELWMVSDQCESGEGVRWIRAPTDDELAELMSHAWVFCMPSTYEGFGLPYLEAMAHAVPVVASPNPGARMLLREGGCGVLAEDRDLGRRLIDLLQSTELRETYASEGLQRAAEYSWESVVEVYEQAYSEAIERWRFQQGKRH